jgi:hypothetical protein
VAQPRIFTSPIKKDASKIPEVPLVDYLIRRLKENGLDKGDKVWMVSISPKGPVFEIYYYLV